MRLTTSRTLLIATFLFIVATIIISAAYSYQTVWRAHSKKEELTYMGSQGWEWYNEALRLQIKYVEGELPAIRKVYSNDKYAALVTISDAGRFRGFIFFDSPCQEGSVISETRYHSSSGEESVDVLHCLRGKFVFMKTWPAEPDQNWRGDVGDFSFEVELKDWDLTPLKRAYYKSQATLI
jgi:hypothetical protein